MSADNSTLTQERLKELLHYDPETGDFRWRVNVSSTGRAGEVAGCSKSRDSYIVIRLDRRLYLAHRLAFLYMEGQFPPRLVDHRDTVKSNNRWGNLRHASKGQNAQNKVVAQSNNRISGLLGIYWSEQHGKWGAKVVVDRRQHHGGFHETPEAAHQAYVELKRTLHPYGTL
jgi:hypothetical protein